MIEEKPPEKSLSLPEVDLDQSDHHFRVDLYMPKEVKKDFDFIYGDPNTNQTIPTLRPNKTTELTPISQRTSVADLNIKDMMTRFLEKIPSKDLTQNEIDFELSYFDIRIILMLGRNMLK